jgi:HEAT repeat protein
MDLTLESAKEMLTKDIYKSDLAELNAFEQFVQLLDVNDRIELLKWMFRDNTNAFVGTRTLAGLTYYQERPGDAWELIKQLRESNDDYDRDTAFYVLRKIKIPECLPLLKPLLDDAYLQIEAIDYLVDIFPEEVNHKLHELASSPDRNKRDAALRRLGQ